MRDDGFEQPNLPDNPKGRRLVARSPEGHLVRNVTPDNAYDINQKRPKLLIHLYDHEERRVIAAVLIPNTRERPDVVMFDGRLYDVVSTLVDPPKYKESMVLEAEPITEEGTPYGTSEP